MNSIQQPAPGSLLCLIRYKTLTYKNRLFNRKDCFRTIFLALMILLLSVTLWTYGYGISKIDIDLPVSDTDIVTLILSVIFTGWMFFMFYGCFTAAVFVLFHSNDMDFLITSPLRLHTIFIFKFIEILVLVAGFGFLIILPILISFGIHGHAVWYYYPVMVILLGFFMTIPTSLGIILCFPVIRFFSRTRLKELLKAIAGIFWIAMWFGMQYFMRNLEKGSSSTLAVSLVKSRPVSGFLPSAWLASFLRKTALGQPDEALVHLILIITTGVVLFILSLVLAKQYYLSGLTASNEILAQVTTKKNITKKIRGNAFSFLPRVLRGFIIKDWLTFKRDLKQFSGIIILAVFLIIGPVILSVGKQEGSLFPFLFVSFLIISAALQTGIRQFPMERLCFWLVLTSPKKSSWIIFAKFVYAAILSTVLLFLSLTGLLLTSTERSVNIPWLISLALSIPIGPTAVGIYLGIRHSRFDWTNPKRTLKPYGIIIYFISVLALSFFTALFFFLPQISSKFMPGYTFWFQYIALLASIIFNLVIAGSFLSLSIRFLNRMEWYY